MIWGRSVALVATMLVASSAFAGGEVQLKLERYQRMKQALAEAEQPPKRGEGHSYLARSLEVDFSQGVVTGRLSAELKTWGEQPQIVPVISKSVTVLSFKLNGRTVPPVRSGSYHGVLLPANQRLHLQVEFINGKEQRRFTRALKVPLPRAAVTQFSAQLPEKNIDVDVPGGILTRLQAQKTGTKVQGYLALGDSLQLKWRRKVLHREDGPKELELSQSALFQVEEELIKTHFWLDYRVLSGATDRVSLQLPQEMEIRSVQGAEVLQWYTEESETATQLVVLLSHLVDQKLAIEVQGQYPRNLRQASSLEFIKTQEAKLREGIVAASGQAGLELKVVKHEGATTEALSKVPSRLQKSTGRPFHGAYSYKGSWPQLAIDVQRNKEIKRTQAVIDELQASTLVTEEGREVTKIRLSVRNNTRQYLRVSLHEGARLTHAMVDGAPIRPGYTEDGGQKYLLVPLRQSERKGNRSARMHWVQPGDTLGKIAEIHYHSPELWEKILRANPQLNSQWDLAQGQRLRIPNKGEGAGFEESRFVVELAYELESDVFSAFGRKEISLPGLDIPVMTAYWHNYLPKTHSPLDFSSNMRQLSAIRYGPLRRASEFLRAVFGFRSAFAGGGHYKNILSSRRKIFEVEHRKRSRNVLTSFPLVGEKYRFKRVLLGEETAYVVVYYLQKSLLPWFRALAFLLAAMAVTLYLRARKRGWYPRLKGPNMAIFLIVSAIALIFGHYLSGSYRSALMGYNVGLGLPLLPLLFSRMRSLAEPDSFPGANHLLRKTQLFKMSVLAITFAFALSFPLLISIIAAIGLSIYWKLLLGRRSHA